MLAAIRRLGGDAAGGTGAPRSGLVALLLEQEQVALKPGAEGCSAGARALACVALLAGPGHVAHRPTWLSGDAGGWPGAFDGAVGWLLDWAGGGRGGSGGSKLAVGVGA